MLNSAPYHIPVETQTLVYDRKFSSMASKKLTDYLLKAEFRLPRGRNSHLLIDITERHTLTLIATAQDLSRISDVTQTVVRSPRPM